MTALDDFKRLSGKLFIEGGLVASQASQRLAVIDPATEEQVGEIADAGDQEIDQAIAIANRTLALQEEPVALMLHLATDGLYRRSPRARFRLLEAHRHVLDAVLGNDPATAEAWMRRHIQDFRHGYIVAGMDFKGPIRFSQQIRPRRG